MANEKHDPWELLREARESVKAHKTYISFATYFLNESVAGPLQGDIEDRLARIDAALAEHDAVPPLPDAEQDGDGWRIDQRERYEGTTLCAVWKANGKWCWQAITQGAFTEKLGYADTLAEAKSAAIAAAKRMK